MQIVDQYDMKKRSLYYLSRLYSEQLKQGDEYRKLNGAIGINILNFNLLNNDRYHNHYLFKENETNEIYTDLMQIHIIELPQIELTAQANMHPLTIPDLDNCQINPSSIMAYLGVRGIGFNNTGTAVTRLFNAIPLLIYWDIYKNYYSNKQEKIGAVIHTTQLHQVHKQ